MSTAYSIMRWMDAQHAAERKTVNQVVRPRAREPRADTRGRQSGRTARSRPGPRNRGCNFRQVDGKCIYNPEAGTLGKGDFQVFIQVGGVNLDNPEVFTLR